MTKPRALLALLALAALLGPTLGPVAAAGRGPASPPTAGPPTRAPAHPLHVAYRAALTQPAVRTATETELRAQLRAIPPIALVNGYWVVPVELGRVYNHPAIVQSLLPHVRGGVGGTHVGLVFVANEFAELLQIPRADLMRLMGVDALRIRATGSYMDPSPSGVNVMTAIDWIQGVFHAFMAWWQNWQAHRQEHENRKNCQDKGPEGDCDGDGTKNGDDECPYDPTCSNNKNGFVGCVIITCQTFTVTFGQQMDTIISQVVQQIRSSSQTGNVIALGAATDRAAIRIAFPPPQ